MAGWAVRAHGYDCDFVKRTVYGRIAGKIWRVSFTGTFIQTYSYRH